MDNLKQGELDFQYDFDGESSMRVPYNDVVWGVYSATSRSTHYEPGTVIDTPRSRTQRTTMKLADGLHPNYVDFRIARAEQYLLEQTYSKAEIIKVLNKEHAAQKKMLLRNTQRRKKYDDTELADKLTASEERFAALNAMQITAQKFPIVYTSSEIEKLLNMPRPATPLKRSAKVRGNCLISTTTTYYHGKDNEEVTLEWGESPLANVGIEMQGKRLKFYSIQHPALLYGYLQGKYFENDLNLINSFDSPIAAILSEWLRLKLFGTITNGHEALSIPYRELTRHLKISTNTKRQAIDRQFSPALKELKEKKIISNASLEPTGLYTTSDKLVYKFTPAPAYVLYMKERQRERAKLK